MAKDVLELLAENSRLQQQLAQAVKERDAIADAARAVCVYANEHSIWMDDAVQEGFFEILTPLEAALTTPTARRAGEQIGD